MTFSSMWPLIFIVAVPIIIILYLLKPKGKDEKISSNVLWERIFKNTQSKTFFEKFVHNILMYIEILIVIALVLALMAPFIRTKGKSGGRAVLVIDCSGSMQHRNDDGTKRFDRAIEKAVSLVDSENGTKFSVVAVTDSATLLIANSSDAGSVKKALRELSCTDMTADMQSAAGLVKTLFDDNTDGSGQRVILFTDNTVSASVFDDICDAEVYANFDKALNLSLDYVSASENGDYYDVVMRITNYGDSDATFSANLYDSSDKVINVKNSSVKVSESALVLFEDVPKESAYLRGEISGISFLDANKSGDSLAADNNAYFIADNSLNANGILIGKGNTFVEKVYSAITGSELVKSENVSAVTADYDVAIYDKGADPYEYKTNILNFAKEDGKTGTVENSVITVLETEFIAGLEPFYIGVNSANTYELPTWAKPVMKAGEQVIAYYGEHDGIKEIVLGFDIRESDFALSAEYPVFMVNCISYLGNSGILQQRTYNAGESIILNPSADYDVTTIKADTTNAGIYSVTAGDKTEYYTVRFPSALESDGLKVADSKEGNKDYALLKVRKNLRNVFITLAIILLVIEMLIFIKQMSYKGKFYLIIRGVIMLLVILALLGLSISRRSKSVTTIFVVDVSESNEENIEEIVNYVRGCLADKPKGNQYGIVTFGKNSSIEQFVTSETSFFDIMTTPDETATNFEDALGRAISMIPSDEAGRIVILTDGKETKGKIESTALAIDKSGIELNAVLYENTLRKDVYIDSAELPGYLHLGDKYTIKINVVSNYDTDAVVRMVSGENTEMEKSVHLNKGANQFVFEQTVTNEDMESYKIFVDAADDTCAKNNEYSVYSMVETVPKLLVISGSDEDSTNFSNILTAAGADFNVVGPRNAPKDLNAMLKYKSIVIENVYYDELPDGFIQNIETYVKDYGCGLICCGGDDSYAVGGYRDTVLENILPVNMDLMGTEEVPSMAMIMVIDHSGSMLDSAGAGSRATNLDIAITSAMGAVDNLRSTDYVGVLTFDDRYEWVVTPTVASDKKAIKDKIQGIREGGGTVIQPAVIEAYNKLVDLDVQIKHIILLTDGQGETYDYRDVVNKIKDANITLSSVAVGRDADTRLLEELAKKCNGRYYYSDISTDIPKIFAQEVFLSGESYIQNGNFSLSVSSGNELVRGIYQDGWPQILGYVCSTPKQSATVVMESEKGDPILTTHRYGLGFSVAWNTDVSGKWTAGFSGDEAYVQLWKRIIDYSQGGNGLNEDIASVDRIGGNTVISYTAVDYTAATKVEALYTDPSGEIKEITLDCTSPGKYEATLPAEQAGLYNINLRRKEDDDITNSVNTAAAVQFSDEYKFDVTTASFDAFINAHGKYLEDPKGVWAKTDKTGKKKFELTNILLILSILLFVYDIAVRRFGYVPNIKKRSKKDKKAADAAVLIAEPVLPVSEALPVEVEKKQKKEKVKKDKPSKKSDAVSMLDTSQLLKKKDDRNIK